MIARYAAERDALLYEGVEKSEMHAIATLAQPSLASNALLVALAIVAPQIAAIGLFMVSLSWCSFLRAERRSASGSVPLGIEYPSAPRAQAERTYASRVRQVRSDCLGNPPDWTASAYFVLKDLVSLQRGLEACSNAELHEDVADVNLCGAASNE